MAEAAAAPQGQAAAVELAEVVQEFWRFVNWSGVTKSVLIDLTTATWGVHPMTMLDDDSGAVMLNFDRGVKARTAESGKRKAPSNYGSERAHMRVCAKARKTQSAEA